jgi:hypothetical protein
MPNERWQLPAGATRLFVLAALAATTSLWAAVAKGRFDGGRADVLRRETDMPRLRQEAERILTLRAELGPEATAAVATPGDGQAPAAALVPFLERAENDARIPKEAGLRIYPRTPKPTAGRPGLFEQETTVEFNQVSVRALVQFLAAAEKQFRALEVREITMNPLPNNQAWSVQVLLVLPVSGPPSGPPSGAP